MDEMNHLNLDTAISAIRRGFAPWACIVEVSGFKIELQCKIVDVSGTPIIDAFRLSAAEVVDPRKLREAIEQTRAKLQNDGFALAPWTPRWHPDA